MMLDDGFNSDLHLHSTTENCMPGSSKNTDIIGLFMNSITHDDISTNPSKTKYSDMTDISTSSAIVSLNQFPSPSNTVSDSH